MLIAQLLKKTSARSRRDQRAEGAAQLERKTLAVYASPPIHLWDTTSTDLNPPDPANN